MNNHSPQLKNFRAELHIHTVLSPCASIEMIPPLIISEAQSKGINLIAITDHNSIDNIGSVIEASKGTNIHVLPGIEIQTREEIHSLCLFDTLDQIQSFFSTIKSSFPNLQNKPDYFGEQFVVDKTGEFIRREERLLISSSKLSLSEIYQQVQKSNGLMIPAHVNRSAFGLLPVLGFLPDDIDIEIVEISKHIDPHKVSSLFPQIKNMPSIQSGDAHFLQDIIGFNEFVITEPTVEEIYLALLNKNGRAYNNFYDTITYT